MSIRRVVKRHPVPSKPHIRREPVEYTYPVRWLWVCRGIHSCNATNYESPGYGNSWKEAYQQWRRSKKRNGIMFARFDREDRERQAALRNSDHPSAVAKTWWQKLRGTP